MISISNDLIFDQIRQIAFLLINNRRLDDPSLAISILQGCPINHHQRRSFFNLRISIKTVFDDEIKSQRRHNIDSNRIENNISVALTTKL